MPRKKTEKKPEEPDQNPAQAAAKKLLDAVGKLLENFEAHIVAVPPVPDIYKEAEEYLDGYRDTVRPKKFGGAEKPLTQEEIAHYFTGSVRFINENLKEPQNIAVHLCRLFTYAYMRRNNLLPELSDEEIKAAAETSAPPELNLPDEIKYKEVKK